MARDGAISTPEAVAKTLNSLTEWGKDLEEEGSNLPICYPKGVLPPSSSPFKDFECLYLPEEEGSSMILRPYYNQDATQLLGCKVARNQVASHISNVVALENRPGMQALMKNSFTLWSIVAIFNKPYNGADMLQTRTNALVNTHQAFKDVPKGINKYIKKLEGKSNTFMLNIGRIYSKLSEQWTPELFSEIITVADDPLWVQSWGVE
jgi:hypothetical protein